MDSLTAFGLFAVTAMLVCYALEQHSPWFILAFAASVPLTASFKVLGRSDWSKPYGDWSRYVVGTMLPTGLGSRDPGSVWEA